MKAVIGTAITIMLFFGASMTADANHQFCVLEPHETQCENRHSDDRM